MRIVLAAALALVPVSAYAADTAPAAAQPAARLTLDVPVEAIVADPAGKAVLDADIPELTPHPQYEMFKGMTLRQLATMVPDKLSAELLAKLEADLAQVK
jgi:hypothetical protein